MPSGPKYNEKLPTSNLPGLVQPGKELDYFVLTKLRPFEEWGNVKWEVFVGDMPKDPEPPVPIIEQVFNNEAGGNGGVAALMRPPSPEVQPDVISCSRCTCDNELTATICIACEGPLP